jgi:hypothetical protein
MFRMTTLKMSLFSALATLFLLVAMLASSGTASAHTASSQAPAYTPHIHVKNVTPINALCKKMFVYGNSFAPGPVTLVATRLGYPSTITPNAFTASVDRVFSGEITICTIDSGPLNTPTTLYGIDHNGVQSNQVLV